MGTPAPEFGGGGTLATARLPKTDQYGNALAPTGGGGGFFQSNLHLGPIGQAIDFAGQEIGRGSADVINSFVPALTGTYQLAHDALAPGYHPSWGQLGQDWGQFFHDPLSVFSGQNQAHDALSRDITGMYHATVHSLNPHEILVHPGNAALTALLIGGFAGGTFGRASEIARIVNDKGELPSSLAEGIAKLQEQRGIQPYEAAKLWGRGSEFTRTFGTKLDSTKPLPIAHQIYDVLAYGLPQRQRLLADTKLSNLDFLLEDPNNQLQAGWKFSKNYTIRKSQELVDQIHRTFPDSAPPLWRVPLTLGRTQSSRIGKAAQQARNVENNTNRLAGKEFLKSWGKEGDPFYTAQRLVAEGTLPEDAIADGQRIMASGSLNPKMRLEMQRRIDTIEAAKPLLGRETHNYPGREAVIGDENTATEPAIPPRTHVVPVATDERLQKFINEGRALAGQRTTAAQLAGKLSDESKFMRNVGPLNYIKYGEVPERLGRLMRSLSVREGMAGRGDFTPEQLARNRVRIEALQARIDRAQGTLNEEEKAKLPTGEPPIALHEAQWLTQNAGLYRVPYEIEKNLKSFGSTAFQRIYKGGKVTVPGTFSHPFKAGVLAHGGGELNTAKLLAESYTEAHRYIAFQNYARKMYAAGSNTPEAIPPAYRILMKDPDEMHVQIPAEKAQKEVFSIKDTHAAAKQYEAVRLEAFPHIHNLLRTVKGFSEDQVKRLVTSEGEGAYRQIKGYKWVDSRTLGGLEKRNPLLGFMEYRGVRGAIHFFDVINTAQKASILYLKPAYAVPNMLGNTFLNFVQQGPFAPYNLALSVAAHKLMDPSSRLRIRAAMGEGSAEVLRPQGIHGFAAYASNQMAKFYGSFVDDPFRFSSFLHEARSDGFRSLSDLHELTHDPRLADQFHDIANRANDEMINYELLSPGEQAIIRRVIFFYPWVKGSSRYATQFLKEHPTAAGVTASVGQSGQRLLDELFPGGLPPWAEGPIVYSKPNAEGYAQVGNPQSAAILQEPADLLRTFIGLFQHNPDASGSILHNLSPADAAALSAVSQGQFSSIPHSAHWSPVHAGLNEAFSGSPLWTYGKFLMHGPNMTGLYPDPSQAHALSRLAFLGSLGKRKMNVYAAAAQAQRAANPTGLVGG